MQHAGNPRSLAESTHTGPSAELGHGEQPYRQILELLPVAVYTCAAPSGVLTFCNQQAVALWGRAPRLGDPDERFCGAWRLFRPDGRPLPHDQAPMAVALAEGRAIRNEEIVIEQPAGTRITARVSIDPIRDAAGRLVGAINVLQDVTERRRTEHAEAHLAAIVASSDDAIVAKTLDGTITSWNAGAERIFGYSAEEAVGRSITMIIPPDRLDEEVSILDRLRRGERIDHYETIRRRRDGTLLDISITVSPIRDGSGRIVGASKIARDITAQKLAEKTRIEDGLVRETLARVGATLAAELDQDKLVQAITDAGTALTGAEFGAFFSHVTDDAGDGFQLYTLSGADPAAVAQSPAPRATVVFEPTFRGDGPVRSDEVTVDPRDGRNASPVVAAGLPRVRSYLTVPVTSRSGEAIGGLFFGHSQAGRFLPRHEQLAVGIASSAAVALDNARLYKEAQDANRVKDEFLATLSHELRTPLNAMLGWAHMLRSMTLPAETQTRALESIERNARAQAQLVEDLLDISRIVSGKLQISLGDVDLTQVVLEAVESVRPAVVAKRLDLQLLVPRHMQLIYEINERLLQRVRARFPGDEARVQRMSLIDERGERSVRMAHLAMAGTHRVNGVSAIHTQLMRDTIFSDFNQLESEQIINITNGITPRRWLYQCNPGLAGLISDTIGHGWVTNLDRLMELSAFAGDEGFQRRFQAAKTANKQRLSKLIGLRLAVEVNPDSLFDVQIKRIHEYKRQTLNLLHMVALYNRLRQEPDADVVPRTVILSGKAAPGYAMAKRIIRAINDVGAVINSDPTIGGRLKVVFIPNYDVTTAGDIIPAADLSQQISLAGTEASGTGNMKLALNGALTIGTLDGANIEMREAVGRDNMFVFGLTAEQVRELKDGGYRPQEYVERNRVLAEALHMLGRGYFSPQEPARYEPLVRSLTEHDPYLVLADFQAYLNAQADVEALYRDRREWTRRAILNVSAMGRFSSDRTVREYAQRVWAVEAVVHE